MRWAANMLAAGLALTLSGHPAMAKDSKGPVAARNHTVAAPHGREVLDEGVTRVAIQAAFHPNDEQQRLLSLLLLLSAEPQGGRSR